MSTKIMKMELYLLKVLESKNIDIDDVVKMSSDEIDNLPLSAKVITEIKNYIARGAKSEEEITKEIEKEKEQPSDERFVPPVDIITTYKIPEEPDVAETNSTDIIETDIPQENTPVVEEKEELVVLRKFTSPEAIEELERVLNLKEYKSIAAYTKHIKTEMSEDAISEVDSETMMNMINKRIAEVKAK